MTATGPRLTVVEDAEALARAGAELVAGTLRAAAAAGRACPIALSGGSTPQAMYRLLAGPEFGRGLPWHAADFFWGDERCVPPESPDSNYGAARRLFLEPLGVDPDSVHPIPAWEGEPAAAAYEEELKLYFDGPPDFELLLLGLGPDGHTASLFPGSPALDEGERWTACVTSPKPPPRRVTLTFPALNAAKRAAFLVSGADKASALADALAGRDVPAARVRAAETLWLADRAAAGELA